MDGEELDTRWSLRWGLGRRLRWGIDKSSRPGAVEDKAVLIASETRAGEKISKLGIGG